MVQHNSQAFKVLKIINIYVTIATFISLESQRKAFIKIT